MGRLHLGWPVVGALTADGSDAVQSVDPTTYASLIGLGTMSLQNNNSVNVLGGNISGVAISGISYDGPIGSNTPASGTFETVTVIGDMTNEPFLKLYNSTAGTWRLEADTLGKVAFAHQHITGGAFTDRVWIDSVGDFNVSNNVVVVGNVSAANVSATSVVSANDINAVTTIKVGDGPLSVPDAVGSSVVISTIDHWGYSYYNTADPGYYTSFKQGDYFGVVNETTQGAQDGDWIYWYEPTNKIFNMAVDAQFNGTKIGFYGTTAIVQVVVSYPTLIVTTQVAGASYTANEQTMLDNLKTDVTNLRTRLNDVITSLKNYGLLG